MILDLTSWTVDSNYISFETVQKLAPPKYRIWCASVSVLFGVLKTVVLVGRRRRPGPRQLLAQNISYLCYQLTATTTRTHFPSNPILLFFYAQDGPSSGPRHVCSSISHSLSLSLSLISFCFQFSIIIIVFIHKKCKTKKKLCPKMQSMSCGVKVCL